MLNQRKEPLNRTQQKPVIKPVTAEEVPQNDLLAIVGGRARDVVYTSPPVNDEINF